MRATLIFTPVLPVIIEKQGLRAALAFVVAGAGADRIDAAPISLGLRMDFRVPVDLARRSLEDPAPVPLREPQHVDRAVNAGLGRLDGVMLVMNWRGRTGEIVDLVNFHVERKGHIVPLELKTGMTE